MVAHVFRPCWLVFTLSLHWLFFQENFEKKIPSSVQTRPFKNVRSIFYAVFKCYDKLIKDFCLLFSLMLYNFFRIKSPPLFLFVCCYFFAFLLMQMAWRCFVTWQRMNRCSLAEETINLMCIGSWRKQTSTYCLTARVALRKLSCLSAYPIGIYPPESLTV